MTIVYNDGVVTYENIPSSDKVDFACRFIQPAADCYISGFECEYSPTSPDPGPDLP